MIHLFSFNMQTQFVILLITPNLMDHIYISPNVNYKETPPATRNSINMIDIHQFLQRIEVGYTGFLLLQAREEGG